MDQSKKEKILSWISRCKVSIQELDNKQLSHSDKLMLLRNHYSMIMTITNVIDGNTKLLGVDKNLFKKSISASDDNK